MAHLSLPSFHTPATLLHGMAYGDTSQGELEKEFREPRKSASRLLNRAGFYSTNPTSHEEMSGNLSVNPGCETSSTLPPNYSFEHATHRAVMLYESR